jgi:chromosome segregation ATPase
MSEIREEFWEAWRKLGALTLATKGMEHQQFTDEIRARLNRIEELSNVRKLQIEVLETRVVQDAETIVAKDADCEAVNAAYGRSRERVEELAKICEVNDAEIAALKAERDRLAALWNTAVTEEGTCWAEDIAEAAEAAKHGEEGGEK